MTSAPGSFKVHNTGAGNMDWSISVIYQGGTGWLVFDPTSGTNEATVKVTANTKTLTAGISLATVIVNAGAAGSQSIAVILTVTAAAAASSRHAHRDRQPGVERGYPAGGAAGCRIARHADGLAPLRQECGGHVRRHSRQPDLLGAIRRSTSRFHPRWAPRTPPAWW